MRRLKKTVAIVVTAANYPEVQTALQAKKDGNPKPAYKLVREGLRSTDQRAYAKMPRPDALQVLIVEIMTPNPGVTPGELLGELRKRVDGRIIYDVTDTAICFCPDNPHAAADEAKISGLKHRMSRARKLLKSSL